MYKRQEQGAAPLRGTEATSLPWLDIAAIVLGGLAVLLFVCLLYTSDAADERSSVDLGGRRIIKKKKDTVEERE